MSGVSAVGMLTIPLNPGWQPETFGTAGQRQCPDAKAVAQTGRMRSPRPHLCGDVGHPCRR